MTDEITLPEPRKLKRNRAVTLIEGLGSAPTVVKVELVRAAYFEGWSDAAAALTEAQMLARMCGDRLSKGVTCIKDAGHVTEHYAYLNGMAEPTEIRWTNRANTSQLRPLR